MLSKSKYTRGMNCHKSLWLYVNKRQEQKIEPATMALFARGTNVGELAQSRFPGGRMAVLEAYPGITAAKRTQEMIRQGVETIYEATFIHADTLVAVDILHKHNGRWFLYEVKATNSVKPEHAKDVAVQYWVVKGSGLDIADAFLMHLNREYVRHGELVIKDLFLPESLLAATLTLQPDIANDLNILHEIVKGEEPDIAMGRHCTSPYKCDFTDYCLSLLPAVDNEAPPLSSEPEVNEQAVRDFVSSVRYPLCHLDFETIMPAVPMFDESRPYQQIPFQYSLHIQSEHDGAIEHKEYLAESNTDIDPRKGLIEKMIEDTKAASTILVYSIAFERTRIKEMLRDFPQYTEGLESIISRMIDLIIPFRRKYYRTETMQGSASIKRVLPALYPEFSYDQLDISDGMAASNAFLDLYYSNDREHIAKTRESLRKYCELDTLAMVKIFETLKSV
jgi:hypothetical protein